MQKFRFDQLRQGSSILITLEGAIGEESAFMKVDLNGASNLDLETAKVRYINSAGVSHWVSWFRQVQKSGPKVKISLRNVPYILIRQVTGVFGFVPDGAKIQSVVVPYCCDTCTSTGEKIFISGTDFNPKMKSEAIEKALTSGAVCRKCGTLMAIEGSVDNYVDALNKYS